MCVLAVAPGEVTIVLDDYGTIVLTVPAAGKPTCKQTSASPTTSSDAGAISRGDRPEQLRLTQMQAMKALFGPLSPSVTVALPAGCELLEGWCPLPLSWNHQDGV